MKTEVFYFAKLFQLGMFDLFLSIVPQFIYNLSRPVSNLNGVFCCDYEYTPDNILRKDFFAKISFKITSLTKPDRYSTNTHIYFIAHRKWVFQFLTDITLCLVIFNIISSVYSYSPLAK